MFWSIFDRVVLTTEDLLLLFPSYIELHTTTQTTHHTHHNLPSEDLSPVPAGCVGEKGPGSEVAPGSPTFIENCPTFYN